MLVLSSMHESICLSIFKKKKKKKKNDIRIPETVRFYNSSKFGVDVTG